MMAYGRSDIPDALKPTPNHTDEGPVRVISTDELEPVTLRLMSIREAVEPTTSCEALPAQQAVESVLVLYVTIACPLEK